NAAAVAKAAVQGAIVVQAKHPEVVAAAEESAIIRAGNDNLAIDLYRYTRGAVVWTNVDGLSATGAKGVVQAAVGVQAGEREVVAGEALVRVASQDNFAVRLHRHGRG